MKYDTVRRTTCFVVCFFALTGIGWAQFPFSENFNGSSLTGWSIVGAGQANWFLSASNNAGGAANEVMFNWTPSFTGDSRLVSPNLVSAAGLITVSFRHYVDWYANPFTVALQTSTNGGVNWTTQWSQTPTANTASGGEFVSVSVPVPATSNFCVCWLFSGYSLNIDYWYIDNVLMTYSSDPPPALTVTTSPLTCNNTANQTVIATITDNATVSNAAIWFRKNGTGAYYSAVATSVVGSTYTFTINYATMGGVVNGDAVNWYIGAVDNGGNVATAPSGGSGNVGNPGSTPPGTPYTYGIRAVASAFPWTQTFDSSPSVTFGGTNSSWRLGAPSGTNVGTTAYSGSNALCCNTSGTYANSQASWAEFGTFDFSSFLYDPVLTFYYKFYTESSWDNCRVEYSTDCGSTWQTLGVQNDPLGVNWYSTAQATATPCSAYYGWCGGPTSTWTKAVHPIPVSALPLNQKNAVALRMAFCCDASVTYEGFVLDDIAIGAFPDKDIQVTDVNVTYANNRWAKVETVGHTVQATIKNNGYEANPASVTLVYKEGSIPSSIVDGTPQTFTPVWAGGTATVNFTTQWVPASTGPRTIYVRAFYTGDKDATNDQASQSNTIQNVKTFGFEDFLSITPPAFSPGFTTGNVNGGATWVTSTFGTIGNGVTYPGDVTTADDWFFSPAAFLQAGSSYRVRLNMRSRTGTTQVLELAYGTAATPGAMTVFETYSNLNSTTFIPAYDITTPSTTPYFNTNPAAAANYYIGIHVKSVANAGPLDIDDIILDENPTPPPKIGYGPQGTPQGSHINNTAVPLNLTAIFKKPGTIIKEYEVVSTTYAYGAPGDFLWDATTTTPWIKLTKSVPAQRQYPTLGAPNGYNPPRPRQLQTFSIEIDPAKFAPGVYTGQVQLYGSLFNSQFPNGIKATNEILNVNVVLTVIDIGSGTGSATSFKSCQSNLATSPNPYIFSDPSNNRFAAVTVTSGLIPSLCIEEFPNAVPIGMGRWRAVQKYWNASAAGTGWTANIDWYYTDSEANAGGVTMRDMLRCVRQPVPGGRWEDPTAGVVSSSNPASFFVTGGGYNPTNIAGNHMVVTDYTPKVIASGTAVPKAFALGQNYPNPFNPSSKIDFSVSEETPVRIVVYNSFGAEVLRLVDEVLPAGQYTTNFDGANLPSGTYMYRMTAGDFTQSRMMMLSK